MTNCDRTADLLYDNLPCQSNNNLRDLNSRIEKSAAKEACFPSFPTIPTPTWDSKIIPTSFPPSPIEQVLVFVYFFIPRTTKAFWVGEHLQQTTAGD
jgi:hypothetical protein